MKNLFLCVITSLFLSACVGDRIDEGLQQCQDIVDQNVEKIWNDCTGFYEDEVIPEIEQQLEDLILQMQAMIDGEVTVYLIKMGCTVNQDEIDCTGSWICE